MGFIINATHKQLQKRYIVQLRVVFEAGRQLWSYNKPRSFTAILQWLLFIGYQQRCSQQRYGSLLTVQRHGNGTKEVQTHKSVVSACYVRQKLTSAFKAPII